MLDSNERKRSQKIAKYYADADPHPLVPDTIRDHPLTISCGTHRLCTTLQRVDTTVGKFASVVNDYQMGLRKDGPGHVLGAFAGERRRGKEAMCISGMGLDNDNMMSRMAVEAVLAASKFFTITVSTFNDGRKRQIDDPERYTRRARREGRSVMPDDEGAQKHLGPGYSNVRFCGEIEQDGTLQYEFRHDAETRSRSYLLFKSPIEGELLRELADDPVALKTLYCYGEAVVGLRDMDQLCFERTRFHYGPLVPSSDLCDEMEISDHFECRTTFAGHELIDMIPVAQEILKRSAAQKTVRSARSRSRSNGGICDYGSLRGILSAIPADCNYGTWFKCLCGIFHETDGSDEGRQLAHDWSSDDSRYDEREVDRIWDSLSLDRGRPVTKGSLIYIARQLNPEVLASRATSTLAS